MADNRYVVNHPKGWAVVGPNAERASVVTSTQAEAYAAARQIVQNLGGGEVRVQGVDSKWQYSNTIAPHPDKCPPKG